MQLEDWLDDLCVRFIVNLPPEELVSVERICFQVEEAQWFYEDFVRPLDPSLPSLSLKAFSLRIFQHCPLFATWSMQHYTSAFAEFLAYKQRVPVRGAIMLNEEMDEVVLVKGWKKGANWSFPRGKINKDENDLDCAVREVYEETGFDIQASGLVKPEKEMKYIEVTMREQHMRLYVFRGVPKNVQFEPKTRKEISKIEWYKLTDLPTLKKKHTHHDGHDENPALNANKFYMVAPFLNPLKKWIAQQKKKENRYSSSHLAAPPLTVDESATDGEPGPATYMRYQPTIMSPAIPSSLPEVAMVQNQSLAQDPSLHLKELLKIGTTVSKEPTTAPPMHMRNADIAKSNALLSLLRGEQPAEMRVTPDTPSAQISPPQVSGTIQGINDGSNLSTNIHHVQPSFISQQSQLPSQQRSLLDLFGNTSVNSPQPAATTSQTAPNADYGLPKNTQQPIAPYQRTGDPQFSRDSPEEARNQLVPPANALPKLTHHTRALLDAFKPRPDSVSQATQISPRATQAPLRPGQQALLDVFKTATPGPQVKPGQTTAAVPAPSVTSPPLSATVQTNFGDRPRHNAQAQSSNASSLLNLFKAPQESPAFAKLQSKDSLHAPVELAAGPSVSPKPQPMAEENELLSALLRKDAPKRAPQATKAGETGATIDGPLNQPHFQTIARSPSQMSADGMRRSPVPAHRTLYDPKQPTPTKILQRADENKRTPAKSPRVPKANPMVQSPKQKTRPKLEKQFQPQILRRPQNSDARISLTPSPTFGISSAPDNRKQASPMLPPTTASPAQIGLAAAAPHLPVDMTRRISQQTETQKQSLLSLLTGQPGQVDVTKTTQPTLASGAVSPLTQSQIVSPLTEEPPISTRSRMGSLASMTSTNVVNDGKTKAEKRQIAAGDKAFLLGYLGRIASQEGHQ